MKTELSRIFKTVFALGLTGVMGLQTLTPCFIQADAAQVYDTATSNAPQYAYMSAENAPVLYGTTAIRVPTGTAIDYAHDARFRVFAKDNEDFDLTSAIQVVSQNVNTAAAGHYEIQYRVTDTDGNTAELTVPVDVVDDSTEIWLEKTMYTLPSVDHLNTLGYSRGNYMDRQIIGIFLDDDANGDVPGFQMRKISGAGDLIVPLQNNNGWCESTATVKGAYDANGDDGWQTVQNTGSTDTVHDGSLASVPTVKTLYKETGPVVYQVKYDALDTRIKPLHYYHEGDGFAYETQFLAEWQADVDSFAVLDGVSLMALMPYEDRAKVYSAAERSFDNFDNMFAFWTRVCNAYDGLIGISYTPDVYWNQAVKTKYFIRANKHGAGSAYYAASDCVGKNATTMYSALHPWWGTLHEYGHGYQGNIGSSGYGMPITEVAVNIFSYYVQELSGFYTGGDHWLGNIDAKEDEWNNKRKAGITYTDTTIGSDTTLYALLNVLRTFGEYQQTYAYINQYYRQVYFTTGTKMNTQDAWILALEEKYNVNLVPYFESWGLQVSQDVKDHMMLSDATVVYYMNDMIADPAAATQLKEQLDKGGEYDLVTMEQLQEAGLTGTVRLRFNIPDFTTIQDKYLYINNGDETIAKVAVTAPEMTLSLPAGMYKTAPPRSSAGVDYDQFYITVVGGADTVYDINYRSYDEGISNGNDVIITARGYWSEDAHPFTVQVIGRQMQFDYQDTYPNSGGTAGNTVFSSLTLYDQDGREVYTKSVNGGWYDTFVDEGVTQVLIDIEIGYTLRVYYRGPKSDMRYLSQLTNTAVKGFELDTATSEQTYVVTQYGLVPQALLLADPDAGYEMYKQRAFDYLDQLVQDGKDQLLKNPFARPELSNHIGMLLDMLRPEDQLDYVGVFTNGHAPAITFRQPSYTYETGTFDLEHFTAEISITDVEEGDMDVKGDNVQITSDVDWGQAGSYTVTVAATDREDNVGTASVAVSIVDVLPANAADQTAASGHPNEGVPNTGDSTQPGLWLLLTAVALCGTTAAAAIACRRTRKE